MKQFFILGRNPELSRAEIISYLLAREIEYKEILFENNLLILDSNKEIKIQELGGTLKSGKIIFEGEEKELKEFLNKGELIPADKFSYSTFGNADETILKEKFKSEKKKAMLKHGRRTIKFQEGESERLADADYELLFHKNKKIYLGLVDQEYNYSEIKKRDMNKPHRREELAISPRLSKILINLSQAKEGDLLFDPFCGVGGILQEAMVKGMKVTGIDKDENAIKQAKENLFWIQKKYSTRTRIKLKRENSIHAPDMQADAIATETPLGILQKKKPSKLETEKILNNFKNLIIPILRRMKKIKKPNAKIAITFPAIREHSIDLKEIEEETGLKTYNKNNLKFPIPEFRPDQFISRDIIVFE